MGGFVNKTYDFLNYELWRKMDSELVGWRRYVYPALKTIVLVVRGFINKDLNSRANALTYSLIFAIVPILAMILAIAKGFGMSDVIQARLEQSFIGETAMVENIMAFVTRYLETAQGGVFLGIGLLVLLWAVYSFFRMVEQSFNNIWNVQTSRSIMRQITTYIAVVFLIPVLIIVSSGISIFFGTAIKSMPVFEYVEAHMTHLLHSIQWATGVIIFTWMYSAIPNTKVQFKSAVIPGILVGTLYSLLQSLSVYVLVFLGRTSIVYGAFASIPILLTWLQWTCLLILIGAEMSYSIQNSESFNYAQEMERMSRRYRDHLMFYLLSIIISRFEEEQPPMTAQALALENRIPIRMVNQTLSKLTEIGILRAVYVEGEEDKTYQPALDTHKITVGMVIERIERRGLECFLSSCDEKRQHFWQNLNQIKKEHTSLENILVSDIANE